MELAGELVLELVPHAGITTVFDETLDIVGQTLARDTHHRGGAHRDAVEHHRRALGAAPEAVGHRHPAHHVEPVFPSHLHAFALALAVGMEVGQQYVVAHVVVYRRHVHHAHAVVAIAVNEHRHPAAGLAGVDVGGMVALARGHQYHGVVQRMTVFQTVSPGPQLRTLADDIVQSPGQIVTVAHLGEERVVEHIGAGKRQHHHDDYGGYAYAPSPSAQTPCK